MAERRGHNEGSIYQRADGLWAASVSVGRTPTGATKRRVIYGKTRKQVAEKLTALLADAQKGITLDPSRQTVEQFFTHWLENAVKGTVRPNTITSYRFTLKHITPTIGDVPLAKLTPQHLVSLYQKKQEEGLTRIVVLVHALLHKGLGQAAKWGLVPRNVATLVDPPRVAIKEFRPLDTEEALRLLEAAEEDRLHALYVLALTCGLRQGELLGLRWSDIDLDKGTLTVRRQLQFIGKPAKAVFSEPKSAKARRTVALPSLAVSALRRHRSRQAEERLALADIWQDDTGLVFTSPVGTPISASLLRSRSFGPLLKRAGLPHIRFHDLRHTTATLLLGQGVHPKLVQEQLGHSQISVTLDLYSHATAPMMRDTADRMDAVLSPRSPK